MVIAQLVSLFGDEKKEEEYGSTEIDEMFHILQNERRRDVLRYLQNNEGNITTSDLAEFIAAKECNKPESQLRSQERKRVYVALYQSHLPKMAEAGAVEYDQDRGDVESGEEFEHFVAYLPKEE